MQRAGWRRASAAALALAAALAMAEAAYWIGARAARDGDAALGACAVLVLGYPSRADGGPHPVQEQRVAAGADAWRRHRCGALVVSGGAAHGPHVEADAMAAIAERLGVPAAAIVRERAARTTIENVVLSLPLVREVPALYVASDGLHAHRGRRIVCRTEPQRCAATFAVAAHEPLARLWWKLPASLHELRAWLRDDAPPRHEIAGLALTLALGALAMLHFGWAILGVASVERVVPTGGDGAPLFVPGRLACAAVGAALLAAAAIALARLGWLRTDVPTWAPQVGVWALAVVFAARAIGERRWIGFAKRVRGTTFARRDSWIYSPIAAALALLACVLALGAP